MHVLVAGATGAIGRPLTAALVARGHEVSGLTRHQDRAAVIDALGARPLIADVLDVRATEEILSAARPDIVVEQLTALPRSYTPDAMRATLAATGRVRTVGGGNLHAAATAAGASRYVAQSGCYYYRPGEGLAREHEPWIDDGPPLVAGGVAALASVERRVLDADSALAGVALRYGFFCGPGTWFHEDGDVARQLREGAYPIVGDGSGRWPFVHIADAVTATVAAIEGDATGAYNVCADDCPRLDEWLPAFAESLGAPPPRREPTTPDTDPDARYYSERLRGADNSLARDLLGLTPTRLPWQ